MIMSANTPHEVVPLPELVVTPSTMQLFMFSAATWNRHRIHYDRNAALLEGHSDVVVHRALLGNFLASALVRWLAGRGQVRELSWKVVSSAVPNSPLRVTGEAVRDATDPSRVRCEMKIVNEAGATVASGAALCVLDGPQGLPTEGGES